MQAVSGIAQRKGDERGCLVETNNERKPPKPAFREQ